jgi:glycosyltransferase involved in cell wall biosynthesis
MKNILLVSQNFFPENFKINDIAFELQRKGYDVTVLTGIPNYPHGSYFNGFGLFKKRIEVIQGVKVYRCFQVPRGKYFIKVLLPLNYLSFMIFGTFFAIFLSFLKKFDLVFVHQVSPITQSFPAIIVKKIQKIPMILWVLDLWPDAFVSGSGIQNKKIVTLLGNYVDFTYRNSDKILISSYLFFNQIEKRVKNSSKIEYFPNWAEDLFENQHEVTIPNLPTCFKIMLAGNLGVSQNLENVMKVALLLKDLEIAWILLGDGAKKKWIELFIKENKLEKSVYLLGKFPLETMPSFYKTADLMLLSLGNEYNDLKIVVPARLQSYMAVGKPVVGFLDGAGAEIINQSECGFTRDADDIEGMVNLIRNILLLDGEKLKKKGTNGKNYYNKYFSRDKCISNLINFIEKA